MQGLGEYKLDWHFHSKLKPHIRLKLHEFTSHADCTDQDHIYIIADNQPYGPFCHPNSRHRRSNEANEIEGSSDDEDHVVEDSPVIPSPTPLGRSIKNGNGNLKFPSPASPTRSESNNPYPSIDDLGSHEPTQQEGEMIMIAPDFFIPRFQLPGHQTYGVQNFDKQADQNETEQAGEVGNFDSDRAHHEPGSFFHVPTTKKTTTKRFDFHKIISSTCISLIK